MAAAFARKSHLCFLFPRNSFYYHSLLDNHKPLFACSFRYLSTSSSTSTNENIKIQSFDFLIQKYHFSPQTVSKISSFSKNPKRIDSVLVFLQETGFSDTQLEKIVGSGYRVISQCQLERIKTKIKIFEDLGFSAVEIAEIVTGNPCILDRSAINTILPLLSMLKDLVGSTAHITKLMKRYGWHTRVDSLLSNIEFLKSCGVAAEQISSIICSYPRFLMLSAENLKRCVYKVDEMGVDRSSKLFVYAVRTVSSMSDANWEVKLKTFRDLGFSNDDISRVLRSAPLVLAVSEKRINSVLEVLFETGKYDMPCIVNCPISLTYSVEKRYKPRLQVLKDLEKKGLIRKWPSLQTLAAMTDEYFLKRFVALLEGCG